MIYIIYILLYYHKIIKNKSKKFFNFLSIGGVLDSILKKKKELYIK